MRILPLILLLCLGVMTSVSGAETDTSEAVFRAFVADVAAGDFNAALEHFDYVPASRKFNFAKSAERAGNFSLFTNLQISKYAAYDSLNETIAKGKAADSVFRLVSVLLLPKKYDPLVEGSMYNPAKGEAAADAAEVVAALDPGQLKNLRIESLELPASSELATEEMMERINGRIIEIWGFEDRIEYLVVYELDGIRFDGGVVMTRYDGKWYISNFRSTFSRVPVFSGAQRRK